MADISTEVAIITALLKTTINNIQWNISPQISQLETLIQSLTQSLATQNIVLQSQTCCGKNSSQVCSLQQQQSQQFADQKAILANITSQVQNVIQAMTTAKTVYQNAGLSSLLDIEISSLNSTLGIDTNKVITSQTIAQNTVQNALAIQGYSCPIPTTNLPSTQLLTTQPSTSRPTTPVPTTTAQTFCDSHHYCDNATVQSTQPIADEDDCGAYYTCAPQRNFWYRGLCPNGRRYLQANASCVTDSTCISSAQSTYAHNSECSVEATLWFPDPDDSTTYYECYGINNGRIQFCCTNGWVYDSTEQTCGPPPEEGSTESSP